MFRLRFSELKLLRKAMISEYLCQHSGLLCKPRTDLVLYLILHLTDYVVDMAPCERYICLTFCLVLIKE